MLEKYASEQPIAYKILDNELNKGKLSHAYLFEKNGYDKSYNFIISFVKDIFTIDSENKSVIYEQVDSNNYPELKVIFPDGMWIKKEQLIDLQSEFKNKTLIGKYKVYIINDAEKLNPSSANTILKFLEEPQPNIIAILITDNIYQLLETIRSRCQTITFVNNNKLFKDITEKEKIGKIITNNNDAYRSFIENNPDEKIAAVIHFADFFEKNKLKTMLYSEKLWHSMFKTKEEHEIALSILLLFYRDVIAWMVNGKVEIFDEHKEQVKGLEHSNIKIISRKIRIINEARNKIRYNINSGLLIDKLIVDMNRSENSD